jgi:hypothetical protein
VLYWFRTPPGVKVGRSALDEDAIRLIEQLNPDVEFDWARILKGQGQPVTETRPPADVRRQRDGRRPPRSQSFTPPPSSPPVVETAPESSPAEGVEPAQPVEAVELDRPEIPPEFIARVPDDTPTPAHAKLGAEGVERLRTRYAEILRRIPERTADPARREELRLQTERLNPDSWVDDDAVVQGLEQYESVLASLRELVGQKRRRRRRGNRQRSGAGNTTQELDASASTEEGESANGSDDEGAGEGNHPEDES